MKKLSLVTLFLTATFLSGCGSSVQSVSPYSQSNTNQTTGNLASAAGLDGTWQVTNITCNGITPDQARVAFTSPNRTSFSFVTEGVGTMTRSDSRSYYSYYCTKYSTYTITNVTGNQFTSQQRAADSLAPTYCAQIWQTLPFDATKAPTETFTYTLNGNILTLTDSSAQDCASIGGSGQMQTTLTRIQ
jgi:Lipocalin-like domain